MPIVSARLGKIVFSFAFLIFCNLLSPQQIIASTVNLTHPEEIFINTSFTLSVEFQGDPSKAYQMKVRIGSSTNQLTKGQTFNEASSSWLSDSSSWSSQPQIETNQDGLWSGTIQAKTATTAQIGENYLQLRIRNTETGATFDSTIQTLIVKELIQDNNESPTNPTGDPILNEFMPNPDNGQEWVEIKNKDITSSDISGWKVDDEEGKSSPSSIPANTIIPAGGFFLFYFSNKLNDTGDSIRLLKQDGSVIESFSFDSTTKGQSYSKDKNGKWYLSINPSPNAENKPNPQVNSTNSINKKELTQNASNPPETQQITSQQIPEILGEKTQTATISSSFQKKENPTTKFSILLISGGLILLLSALVFIFREKIRVLTQRLEIFKKK